MMLKQKSSPWARLKYLYVLPLAALTVVAFARPEISHELEKISSVKISEIIPVQEKKEPKRNVEVETSRGIRSFLKKICKRYRKRSRP